MIASDEKSATFKIRKKLEIGRMHFAFGV